MRPSNEAELVEAIQSATAPISIQGGASRAADYAAGEVLHTGGLTGVRLYEPGALTLVAGAGTPLDEVQALLATERQRLAFEPPDLRRLLGRQGLPTLGGMAAMNASGPRRLQVGACRDAMLGLRFVDGTGALIKNGGRVMKNVTGYDLVKLLAGAAGRLGVISELSLRLAPCPETEASLRLPAGPDPADLMARALATPYELSGAALCPDGDILLRLEGFATSVSYRLERLQALLGGERVTDVAASGDAWRAIRDAEAFAGDELVMRLSIRPSRLRQLQQRFAALRLMADWGGGLVWLGACGAPADLRAAVAAVRAFCTECGGHASLVKRPAELRDLPLLQPEPLALAQLSDGIRHRFDPRGILNTGPAVLALKGA